MSFLEEHIGTRWEEPLGPDTMSDLGRVRFDGVGGGPYRSTFSRAGDSPNYPRLLGKPPVERILRRPFSTELGISKIQETRSYVGERPELQELLKRICDFYLTLCHPFRALAASAATMGFQEYLNRLMYEDLKEIRDEWESIYPALLGAQATVDMPDLLKDAFASSTAYLEGCMATLEPIALNPDMRSRLTKFLNLGNPSPSVAFGRNMNPFEVKRGIQNALGTRMGINHARGDISGVFNGDNGDAEPLAFLEYLHTAIGFDRRLKGFMVDPSFTDDGSLSIQGLHNAAFLYEGTGRGKTAPSLPQGSIELAPEQRTLVIAGPNNAGKSHFLGGFGQALLMAQAGLAVTAHHAKLPLATGLHTHQPRPISENAVGKFETEVRLLRGLADSVKPGHWVLIDEMLAGASQRDSVTSTAQNVLRALTEKGARVVLVTHDLELVHRLSQESSTAVYVAGNEADCHQFTPADAEAVRGMTEAYDETVDAIAQRNGF